jgi:hypothetical protein
MILKKFFLQTEEKIVKEKIQFLTVEKNRTFLMRKSSWIYLDLIFQV